MIVIIQLYIPLTNPIGSMIYLHTLGEKWPREQGKWLGKYSSPMDPLTNVENHVGTVDGQNPAPARMMIIPLFLGF